MKEDKTYVKGDGEQVGMTGGGGWHGQRVSVAWMQLTRSVRREKHGAVVGIASGYTQTRGGLAIAAAPTSQLRQGPAQCDAQGACPRRSKTETQASLRRTYHTPSTCR